MREFIRENWPPLLLVAFIVVSCGGSFAANVYTKTDERNRATAACEARGKGEVPSRIAGGCWRERWYCVTAAGEGTEIVIPGN